MIDQIQKAGVNIKETGLAIILFIFIINISQVFSQEVKMTDKETMIKTDSLEICSESFGDPDNPAVLLIMGASASMVWWDAGFCQQLADKGGFVIRYDNRDVGRSTTYEPGKPGYDVIDMSDDALRVLDHYKIDKAHFAGMSLGGMIAQIVALRHPERVLTLTMIASGIWDDRPDLPPVSEKILNYHSSAGSVDWSDRSATINYMVGGWKILNGSRHEFDEKRAHWLAETEYDRANNLLSMFNHSLLKGGEDLYGKADRISFPTLVIHGTEDPVLPYEHGKAIAETIPNSKLVTLEGSGHEIHYNEWDRIIREIIDHTK